MHTTYWSEILKERNKYLGRCHTCTKRY